MPDSNRKSPGASPDAAAGKQRRIQAEQDRRDAAQPKEGKPQAKGASQAGARKQPEQLPAQHLQRRRDLSRP
jgi:hypothetical protein